MAACARVKADVDLTTGGAQNPPVAAKKKPDASAEPDAPKRARGKPTALTGAWATMATAAGGVIALAERLKVDRRTVLRWATGERKMDDRTVAWVRMIAAALGVPSPV